MRYVIVGGSAGGATAAARLRRNTEAGDIILFEKGACISPASCGLPYYVGGLIPGRGSLFVQTPESFSRRYRIDVRTLSEVTSIDTAAKTVSVRRADGSQYVEPYDKLLLSPGASPLRPRLPGIDAEGIFTLRDANDAVGIREYAARPHVRRAVVVGGGFIGLEMAENLRIAGLEVDLVEQSRQVMASLDCSMAALIHEHLLQNGVRLHLGRTVTGFIHQPDGSLGVSLNPGCMIATDLAVLSIGVRAETTLALAAGLKIGEEHGIAVNEFLQTSDESVFAVGDAIEFPHPLTGKPWINFLAGPANRQARIAADNMVFGNRVRYEGSIGTSIAKVFGLAVASAGLPAKVLKQCGLPCLSATIHPLSSAGYYPGAAPLSVKITFAPDTGRLYGAQVVGSRGVDKRIDAFAFAIKHGCTVDDLAGIEHAYSPPFSTAKDPVAMAGYVAGNILCGRMTPIYWHEIDGAAQVATLVDVRTAREYSAGHISGSVNIPLDELRERLCEVPSGKPVIVYCAVGMRGYLASNILKANCYSDVCNLVGGYKTYRAAKEFGYAYGEVRDDGALDAV